MKEFTVKVTRTLVSEKTFTVRTETAEQAVNSAFELAQVDDWSGDEISTKFNVGFAEEVKNDYIDQYGEPYDSETGDSWPAGGGLHKDCDYNAEALYAYYTIKNRDDIYSYLTKRGFRLSSGSAHCEVYTKGNTEVWYESYEDGMWGYMHTELVEEE